MRTPRARAFVIAAATAPLVALSLACGLGSLEDDTPPPPAAPQVPATPAADPSMTPPAQVTPPRVLGCIASSAIDSSMTPVELYASMEACARAARPADAMFLFAIAGAYGRFDTFRVADRSAHGAVTIVRQAHVDAVPPDQWQPVQQNQLSTSGDPAALARMCGEIRRIGRPMYYPTYMIQHGMRMFTGNSEPPLVSPFDPSAAWSRALDEYLHCPAS